MARKRGIRLSIPGVGKLGTNQSMILLAGGAGLAVLAYLAYSGKTTGIGFVDTAADRFEDIYEDYLGPLGPAEAATPPPVQAAPVVPTAPATASMDDMVFSGAYATDAPMPYQDWWNNNIDDDDRIIVA